MSLFDDPDYLIDASPKQLAYLRQLIRDTEKKQKRQRETILEGEVIGFSLGGNRRPDGKIAVSGSTRVIDEWPEVLPLNGNRFTLENVVESGPEGTWEEAQYC